MISTCTQIAYSPVLFCWQGNSIRGPAAESLGRILQQNVKLRWYEDLINFVLNSKKLVSLLCFICLCNCSTKDVLNVVSVINIVFTNSILTHLYGLYKQ